MNKVLLNSRNIDRSYISSMNVTESCYLIEVRTIFEWHNIKAFHKHFQIDLGSVIIKTSTLRKII